MQIIKTKLMFKKKIDELCTPEFCIQCMSFEMTHSSQKTIRVLDTVINLSWKLYIDLLTETMQTRTVEIMYSNFNLFFNYWRSFLYPFDLLFPGASMRQISLYYLCQLLNSSRNQLPTGPHIIMTW